MRENVFEIIQFTGCKVGSVLVKNTDLNKSNNLE